MNNKYYFCCNDKLTEYKLISTLTDTGYVLASDFKKRYNSYEEYKRDRDFYLKNTRCKNLYINTFFNRITNNNEILLTVAPVIRSHGECLCKKNLLYYFG